MHKQNMTELKGESYSQFQLDISAFLSQYLIEPVNHIAVGYRNLNLGCLGLACVFFSFMPLFKKLRYN